MGHIWVVEILRCAQDDKVAANNARKCADTCDGEAELNRSPGTTGENRHKGPKAKPRPRQRTSKRKDNWDPSTRNGNLVGTAEPETRI